jgi:hypothetical protein
MLLDEVPLPTLLGQGSLLERSEEAVIGAVASGGPQHVGQILRVGYLSDDDVDATAGRGADVVDCRTTLAG